MLKGNQEPKGYSQLAAEAKQLGAQGQQLQSGNLPAGIQSSLNTAKEAALGSVRQQYANSGMSGSSAEAQDLANVQLSVAAQGANIAQQLLAQGVQESELSGQLYQQLMAINMQQDQELSSSFSNFAQAFAGMNRPLQPGSAGAISG